MKLLYTFLAFAVIATLVFLSRTFLKWADGGRPVLALIGLAAGFLGCLLFLIGLVLKYLALPAFNSMK